MLELLAHITATEVPSFWLAFVLGFAAGAVTLASVWQWRKS